ncbi:hypothetical protein JCM10449v2_001043 [Rhodotorula kratochvilovae]
MRPGRAQLEHWSEVHDKRKTAKANAYGVAARHTKASVQAKTQVFEAYIHAVRDGILIAYAKHGTEPLCLQIDCASAPDARSPVGGNASLTILLNEEIVYSIWRDSRQPAESAFKHIRASSLKFNFLAVDFVKPAFQVLMGHLAAAVASAMGHRVFGGPTGARVALLKPLHSSMPWIFQRPLLLALIQPNMDGFHALMHFLEAPRRLAALESSEGSAAASWINRPLDVRHLSEAYRGLLLGEQLSYVDRNHAIIALIKLGLLKRSEWEASRPTMRRDSSSQIPPSGVDQAIHFFDELHGGDYIAVPRRDRHGTGSVLDGVKDLMKRIEVALSVTSVHDKDNDDLVDAKQIVGGSPCVSGMTPNQQSERVWWCGSGDDA